jgi:thiol-disulfide isomerase/thioredoxin
MSICRNAEMGRGLMRRLVYSTTLVLVSGGVVIAAPNVGDKAPPIVVEEWISAGPAVLPGAEGSEKHVFAIEFWATWCAPCKQTLPFLNRLQEKYRDQGLIVLGLSNEEAEVVRDYARKNKMNYAVGVYEFDSGTARWTEGRPAIPYAYIVDRKGQVVWGGHPLTDMEQVLERVMAGTFDVAAEKRRIAMAQQTQTLMRQASDLYRRGDLDGALRMIEELIEMDRQQLQPHMVRRQLLRELNRLPAEIEKATAEMEAAVADSAPTLLEIARVEMMRPRLAERDPALALRSIRRAADITQNKNVEILTTLARVECELGMIDAAIETQTRVVALLEGKEAEEARLSLEYYRTVRTLADASRRAPTSPSTGAASGRAGGDAAANRTGE